MNEFLTYEFTTHQKNEGPWIAKRLALVIVYILYVITLLVIGFLTRIILPLLAFVPLTLWILVFFTWRYVDVDYECSMTSGILTFSKIYGSRARKKIFETPIKSMMLIAPYEGDAQKRIDRYAPEIIYDARSSIKSNRQHFALFENEKGKKALFLFEADDKCLKIFKFYNSSTQYERSVNNP